MVEPIQIPIIIPSMSRAGLVTTHKMVTDPILCVPESQSEAYREHYPEIEIQAHPDSIKGLPLKRQWINDRFDTVFQMDDDLTGMFHMGIAPTERQVFYTPSEVRDIIQGTYETALELGCFVFGFNNVADIRMYNPLRPIQHTGFIPSGYIGFIDWKKSGLFYNPKAFMVDDYWIICLNAYYHRYTFRDNRFGFREVKNRNNSGGQAMFRNWDNEKQGFELLKKYFGDVVRLKPDSSYKRAAGKSNRHPYERMLVFPF